MVALEGQGQDELFDILAGSDRPSGGELLVDGTPVSFRHPADAIRAGLVYVAGRPRRGAADAALGAREHRAAVHGAHPALGPDQPRRRAQQGRRRGRDAADRRARRREVRRLSGGNQQKVTIARWVAGGVTTMLCFDPTRGIDIRTKQQIYVLLRDLAEAGAAVLLYTSELKEIQLACDRAIVIFGGRVVAEIAAATPTSRRCCARRTTSRPTRPMPGDIAAEVVAAAEAADRRPTSAAAPSTDAARRTDRERRDRPSTPRRPARGEAIALRRRNAWTLGLLGFFALLLVFTRLIQPNYGATGIQGLAISVLPLALAAVAQAIVVISGGIDLSIGSMMALTSVVAATLMKGQSRGVRVAVVIGVLLLGLVLGAINGGLVVSRACPTSSSRWRCRSCGPARAAGPADARAAVPPSG